MKGVTIMPVGAMIFLGVILLVFTALDIFMLVSLLKPGDERNQIIVWKASSFTLLATIGSNMIDVIENFVKDQYMSTNPFIQLEVAAILFFLCLNIEIETSLCSFSCAMRCAMRARMSSGICMALMVLI